MKTNVISNFRDYQTVTHPIQADDLKTCKVYQYSPARYIVTDYNEEQRADLLEITKGKETPEGIVFAASKWVRDRLHSWQNYEAQKQRAAILGEGWQYISGLRHGTEPGDVVCCVDGTRGRVTKSDPESCCIEFETADGRRLSVAGYFRYTPSEKSETDAEKAFREALTINVGDRVKVKSQDTPADVTAISEDGQYFTVKFVYPVREFWTGNTMQTATYSRYGITRNYDRMTGEEIVGNAQYYAEELQADYWEEHEPRTFKFGTNEIEVFAPTEKRPTWLVVPDIFSEPKQATLYEICDYLAALYQENHKAA